MTKTKKQKEALVGMKEADLKKKLISLEEEVQGIKFKAEGARSKNVKEMWNLRKQIARVLTKMNAPTEGRGSSIKSGQNK